MRSLIAFACALLAAPTFGQTVITDSNNMAPASEEILYDSLSEITIPIQTGNSANPININRYSGLNVTLMHTSEPDDTGIDQNYGNLFRQPTGSFFGGVTKIQTGYSHPPGFHDAPNGIRFEFDQPVAEFGVFYNSVVSNAPEDERTISFFDSAGLLIDSVATTNVGPDPLRFIGLSSPTRPIAFVEYGVDDVISARSPALFNSFIVTVPAPGSALVLGLAAGLASHRRR